MQPDNSASSIQTLHHLRSEGTCKFDITMHGARLRAIHFGSRGCTDRERHFNSFVREAAYGHWSISQNRKFLWGAEFFWLCDCSAMREILEYDGPIHQIRRWAQELLGYYFQIFHRPARIMRDVDGLSRRFDDPLLASYFTTAGALALYDATERPAAYYPATFKLHNPLKCPPHTTPPPSTDIHASSFPLLLAPETATAVFPDRAVLANLPLRYQPTAHAAAGNPPPTTCHPVAPSPSSVRNGSHFLLMNHTLAWFSLTPQFGAIPSALADHSKLFPVASLTFHPSLLPATAMCRARVPSSYFSPCSLTALLRNLVLLRTPFTTPAPAPPLDHTLLWFLDRHLPITGIDCSCPHHSLPAQLLWLQATLLVLTLLTTHFHLSTFLLFLPPGRYGLWHCILCGNLCMVPFPLANSAWAHLFFPLRRRHSRTPLGVHWPTACGFIPFSHP
jgi:hypothetical protein